MPGQTGRLAGEKKWLVPRYPQLPGTLIFLGSILTDPENLESSLNRKTGIHPIPEEDRLEQTAAVRREIQSRLATDGGAFLGAVPPDFPLFNVGAHLDGRANNEVQTIVEAMKVTAEVFLPDKAYVDAALNRPEVAAYIRETRWAKSLYMIVGVATAGEITITETQSRERTASASAMASITGAGDRVGMEISGGRIAEGGSTVDGSQSCDFAYRVREIRYYKFRKPKDRGDLTEGVLFGKGRDAGSDPPEDDVVTVFKDLGEADIAIPEMFTLTTA